VSGATIYGYVLGDPVNLIDPWGLFKINLMPPGSGEWHQGNNTPDDPSKAIVIGHSDYNNHLLGPDGKIISIEEVVRQITSHPDWKDGMPVDVRACAAGDQNNGDSIVDQIKKLIPGSIISGPHGDITPGGAVFWPPKPRYGIYPYPNVNDRSHWKIR
jgi:hypothetical protein